MRDYMQWTLRTTAFHDATFDRCLGVFDALEPYVRNDRLNLLRVLAGRRDLRARVGSRAPTLDRLRRATEATTDGFSVSFWFQPRGSSPWSNHDDLTFVSISVQPQWQRPGHVEARCFASLDDVEATTAVLERIIGRWGAEFGAAWFGMESSLPFWSPYLPTAIGRDEVIVDTLGPTWLTVVRPEVAQRLDEGWRRAHGLEVAVTPVGGPGGRHEIWRLAETPQNLDRQDADRWAAALGASMPPTEFPGWPSA